VLFVVVLYNIDFKDLKSIDRMVMRVRSPPPAPMFSTTYGILVPEDPVVTGRRWDSSVWRPALEPERELLF